MSCRHLWSLKHAVSPDGRHPSGETPVRIQVGGVILTDTCSAFAQAVPPNTRVAALDSAKQAHYLPAILGLQAWFGSTRDCIDAAVTGRWKGEAPR